MAGGGGDVVPVSPRAEQPAAKKRRTAERRHQAQAAARLPVDIIIAEIAARSDPATLVRCAAICRDARRRALAMPDRRRELRADAPRESGAGERDGSPGELPPWRRPRDT